MINAPTLLYLVNRALEGNTDPELARVFAEAIENNTRIKIVYFSHRYQREPHDHIGVPILSRNFQGRTIALRYNSRTDHEEKVWHDAIIRIETTKGEHTTLYRRSGECPALRQERIADTCISIRNDLARMNNTTGTIMSRLRALESVNFDAELAIAAQVQQLLNQLSDKLANTRR